MTIKKSDHTEAMIDEALVESFPASDPPSWTLGIDAESNAAGAPKGSTYQRRHAVLALLSDEQVARISTFETALQLADGEEYLDLSRPERGALRAQSSTSMVMGNVLPRSAVSDETWAKLLVEAHRSLLE